MSIKLVSMAWEAAPLSGSELLCLLAMCDWANDDGGSLHPSMQAIARKIRVSEKQARRIVQGLVEAGYLTVVGNPHGGAPGSTKQWVINVRKLRELAARKQAVADATTTVYGTPPTGVPDPSHGCPSTPPMGVTPPVDGTPPTGVPDPSHGCPSTPPTGVPDPSHRWEPNRHRTVNRTVNEPLVERACARAATDPPDDVDQQVFADWLAVRRAKRAGPVTPTVLAGMRREAAKAGIGLQEAIAHCCVAGWQGFRADWYLRDRQPVARGTAAESYAEREAAYKRRRFEEMAGRRPAAQVVEVDAMEDVLAVPMIGREGGTR
ncbi:helix-turn-helix domain-containing protein [Tepidimonas charontis]|uniref:Helix-turn-helix domain protein n=1 Tax=Tepidimonas charontis TaxID=2267262 RepID=A0A554X355_9BURK|nr:helix-turn-helix domain-containing protein [Tepidimonas charontis]TSE30196.1 Helix-turn-helix domain protein [Tepidimonas charontis]